MTMGKALSIFDLLEKPQLHKFTYHTNPIKLAVAKWLGRKIDEVISRELRIHLGCRRKVGYGRKKERGGGGERELSKNFHFLHGSLSGVSRVETP